MSGAPQASGPDQIGMQFLAGQNPGMRRVLESVMARQRGSLAMSARAGAALSATPSLLAYEAPLLPLCVARASGSRITDVDGNEYIDCHMAYTASVLGHNPPAVLEAVGAALARGLQGGHFFPEQVELGELLREMVPGAERVALFHTGGEAVAAAVRMARVASGLRPRVAKFEGCYHGANDVGLHNPWMVLAGRLASGPLDAIPPQAATAGVRTDDSFLILPFNSPVALDLLRRHASELACVVVDPTPPFMSNWPEDCRSFVTQLCATAREVDVPVVFDEVVCGFRLAPGGAREWSGQTPQISCYGKITSGLGIALAPIAGEAAFLDLGRSDGTFRDYTAGKVWLSSTLSSSFLAVVASLAQLRQVRDHYDEVFGRIDRSHAELRQRLDDFARRSGIPVSLQGHPRLQSQLAIGKPEPPERSYRAVMQSTSLPAMRSLMALVFYLRQNGIYVKTVPSMNLSAAHTEEDVAAIAAGIEAALAQMQQDGMLPP
jgi:glutamate-1-semialdehyde 2,1-aminomutase